MENHLFLYLYAFGLVLPNPGQIWILYLTRQKHHAFPISCSQILTASGFYIPLRSTGFPSTSSPPL
jgi:hypothetical protein